MIIRCPQITEHAYRRAEERLELRRDAFAGWVGATWRFWMPVDQQFLWLRHVDVARHGRFYATPWTSGRGVVLVLSEDNVIKTVIDFDEPDFNRLPDIGLPQAVAMKLIHDGHVAAEAVLEKGIGRRTVGDSGTRALEAYLEGRIDHEELAGILSRGGQERDRQLEALLFKKIRKAGADVSN